MKIKKLILILLVLSLGLVLACTGTEENINSNGNNDTNNNQESEMETPDDFACGLEIADIPVEGMAEDFTLKNQAGEEVRLSDYEGMYIHLEFSAEWCPMSKAQAEYMADAKTKMERYPDFVSINVLFHNTDFEDASVEDAKEWMNTYGLDMVMAGTEELAKKWNVKLTPSNFVIAPDMEILGGWSGAPDNVAEFIKKLELIAPGLFTDESDTNPDDTDEEEDNGA